MFRYVPAWPSFYYLSDITEVTDSLTDKPNMYKPAQIFASLDQNSVPKKYVKRHAQIESKKPFMPDNEIQVTASELLSIAPDRCKVHIHLSSSKENVQEVKNSITRRLDYVTQTLNNYQIKEGEINISRTLRKEDGLCLMNVSISVVFVDVNKCQTVCNFLAEKLDESVKISFPEFFHGSHKLENLRKQACLKAVHNAKIKATEIARVLGQALGQVITVREDSITEWNGSKTGNSGSVDTSETVQEKIEQATLNICVKVSARFQIKAKAKIRKLERYVENEEED